MKKTLKEESPCWDGYEMVGMKMKDGKEVPNCVPKNESVDEAASFKITNTISKKEWAKTHKDYKTVIDGVPYVMKLTDKGTALVPVKIVESVNEAASKEAMGIAAFTGTRGIAVQNFIDDYNLDARKLFNFVKNAKLKDRTTVTTAIAGKSGNKYQGDIVAMFGESVNEGYGEFIKAKNLTDIIKLSKQKKNATFYVTDDNNSRIGAFYLKNGKFAKATTANANYDLQNSKTSLKDRSDVIYKYKVDESINEAQKINSTSKKFLKGMKQIKVKGLGGYMPGVDYVYVDGDKYYFVDFEGDHMELKNTDTIKQLHKLHGSALGESVVSEAKDKVFVVMFKAKKDLSNRSIKPSSAVYAKEADAKKFLKSVENDGGNGMIVKSNKPVGVKVNEGPEPQIKKVAQLTGARVDAVEKYVSSRALNITKLLKYLKDEKYKGAMDFIKAVLGDKKEDAYFIKMFKESVNETVIKEYKHKIGSETIQFKVSSYRTGISLIAASSNDLDKLQDAIGSEDDVKGEIRKSLEKKLRIPIEIDRNYEGAGFGFKIDLYSLAKMVK